MFCVPIFIGVLWGQAGLLHYLKGKPKTLVMNGDIMDYGI